MALDLNVTIPAIIELVGYAGLAVALYFGIKIDLARMHERIIQEVDRSKRAQETADNAHVRITGHVIDFHTDRRNKS